MPRTPPTSCVVALLQMDCVEGNPDENYRQVRAAAAEAADRGATILALPELWSSGYDLARATDDQRDWDAVFSFLAETARQHRIALLGGSVLERVEGGYHNCAVAVGADGRERSRYRKLHLFRPLEESRYLLAGHARPETFDLAGFRCAQVICYDLRFPEVFRSLAMAGVELVAVPAQWPRARIAHWRSLMVARAIESQCFVLGVNRRGRFGDVEFPGHSLLVDPRGEILIDAGEDMGLHCADLEPGAVREWRGEFPVLDDRRMDLYPP